MELSDLEQAYLESLKSQYLSLKSILEVQHSFEINLTSNEITLCLLERLNTYYEMQYAIKNLLRKRYITAGADYFVESVAFFLKLVLERPEIGLEIHSERQVRRKRGSIRPDISIWKNDELIAIVECKTQLGWNRGNWEEHFEARKTQLIAEFSKAKAYLLVMTDLNWGGFKDERHQALLGKEYFCLLKGAWPGTTSFDEIKKNIFWESCIEKLIVSIVDAAQNN
ncbi:hypothetical protein JOY44_30395 (plasmid) [Phormidium sp. CLA17]|uniref:hypothetical protein n=1 Tax=Leptolyngbya sp. Cla-17 TaxID=2803751 RepID=UPI001492EB0F|nr:hypothetical protein [Leptolyngbya sp. Cla-17]MBM0745728.1 hypothetical protein [Leptolyngbya sp. Cla-17]